MNNTTVTLSDEDYMMIYTITEQLKRIADTLDKMEVTQNASN